MTPVAVAAIICTFFGDEHFCQFAGGPSRSGSSVGGINIPHRRRYTTGFAEPCGQVGSATNPKDPSAVILGTFFAGAAAAAD